MSHRNVTFTSLARGAALLAAWLLVQPGPARAQPGGDAPGPGPQAGVAVQPFINLSGRAADAWIGAGIAASLFADLNAAGAAAEPRWLVQGSYQRVGDSLRITAELVDPVSSTVIAAARADGELSALLALQDAVADQLADALAAHESPAGWRRPAGPARRPAPPRRARGRCGPPRRQSRPAPAFRPRRQVPRPPAPGPSAGWR